MNVKDLVNDKMYVGVICVLDSDLNIIDASQNFLDLTGYEEGELNSKKFTDLVLPNDKSKIFDVLYGSLITSDITIKLYHKSGSFRFFSLIVQSFTDSFLILGNSIKKDFIGYDYNTDLIPSFTGNIVSENVENLKDLLDFQDSSLNFVLDMLPIDVWIKDKYGKYMYCNKTFSIHTGYSLKDIYMKNDYQIFDSDRAREFETSDNSAIESGDVLNYIFESKSEKLLTWTEVTKIPLFNLDKEYIGIIGFSIDITSIKKAEESYKKELEIIKRVSSNLDGVIYEIDPKGTLLYSSGLLKESFDKTINDEFGVLNFINSKKEPYLNDQIRLAYGGNKKKITTTVGKYKVEFSLIPVPNKYGTNNLVGYGTILGEIDE